MSLVGASLNDLETRLKEIAGLKSSVYLEVEGNLEEVQFTADSCGRYIRAYMIDAPGSVGFTHAGVDSITEALRQIVDWFSDAKLLVDTIVTQTTQDSDEIRNAVRGVWCETFPSQIKNDNLCTEDPMEHRRDALGTRFRPLLHGGVKGISKWNKLRGQHMVNWSHSDLSSAHLKGANLRSLNWQNSRFDNAQMEGCNLSEANVSNASLQGANLSKSNLQDCEAENANFANSVLVGANLLSANLKQADLTNCDLRKARLVQSLLMGVDLSTCKIDEKTNFSAAKYDETTKLPQEFPQWRQLIWRGRGSDPYREMIDALLSSPVEVKFEDFLQYLQLNFDFSKVQKAISMMKKEKFQLFAEVSNDSVVAVIKSQTDPDLVYASLLDKDGVFSCCTQNLKVCGGLKGSMCKHHLVMLMGLVKHKELNANVATQWALNTIGQSQKLNKDIATQVFIKYKGVQVGEIDWRPIETIPEDYYSF